MKDLRRILRVLSYLVLTILFAVEVFDLPVRDAFSAAMLFASSVMLARMAWEEAGE